MPIAEDDLKKGMIVTVVGRKVEPPDPPPWVFAPRRPEEFSGNPVEVVAVSLPFVAVTNGERTFSIDLRCWVLGRVSRAYRDAMSDSVPASRRRKKRRPEKPDPSRCVNCGDRLAQVLRDRKWYYYCRHCRKAGDEVI